MAPLRLLPAFLIPFATAAAAEPLDPADEAFRAASYTAAWTGPLGAAHGWKNPASGHAGSVKATKERIDPASHRPCREIEEIVSAGPSPATGYAVGCRGSDGSWQIVQSSAATGPVPTTSAEVPADVAPYVAPADINAPNISAQQGDAAALPPQVRILVPYRGAAGATPPAPH